METTPSNSAEAAQMRTAMSLSLAVGFLMLALKMGAYFATSSSALLSDAAESVVHIAAVAFAAYSLRLSFRPPDADHRYGHAKISYFSAGFEGAMIILAAIFIIYDASREWYHGPSLENIWLGAGLAGTSVVINTFLGVYLVRLGRRRKSVILEANGSHVLTDVWTSIGVIGALVLVKLTGWVYWDPIVAIAVALNILFAGFRLIRRSFGGLMDRTDPAMDILLKDTLKAECASRGIRFHQLRHRNLGNAWWVELHLLFPKGTLIEDAHELATQIEDKLESVIPGRAYVSSHLEPIEGHDAVHRESHFPH